MGRPRKVNKVQEDANAPFTVVLTTAGKEYRAEGPSVLDCLIQFKKVDLIKSYSFLTAKHEGRSYKIIMSVPRFRRFLINDGFKQILAKQLTTALK